MSAGLGNLPDIFQKYVNQPWFDAYRQLFESYLTNPGQGSQVVTLPPMTTPVPQVPTQPTSYAPFTGALPTVAAVNPWGTNNFQAYDNQGDMDARMAMGGWGAQMPVTPVVSQNPPTYQAPGGPANPVPTVPRPPVQQPGGPANPVQTVPRPPVPSGYDTSRPGWYNPTPGYGYGQWPNIGRGYTPATNFGSGYTMGTGTTGMSGRSSIPVTMYPTDTRTNRARRSFTGWGG